MKTLYIASRWDENNLKATWAGTSYSLMVALSRIYSVRRVQVEPSTKSFIYLNKISRRVKYLLDLKFRLVSSHLNKLFASDKQPVLMYPCIYKTKNPYFLYRDNTYEIYKYYNEIKYNNPWPIENLDKILNVKIDLQRISEIEEDVYKNASGIFFMGEWLAQYMKTKHPEFAHKIYAVGGGINFELNNTEIKREGNKILFVGKDFYRKGGDVLIKAFKVLKNSKMKDLELHIVGPTENPAEGVYGIYYHGLLDFDEVKEMMSKCDVFCMPSYFEAYGLVFIEALCMGLPCIGRNCWEMPYFIKEGITGELLKSDSHLELAKLIEKVLSDESYARNVKLYHDFYVKKYSWDSVAERISNIIDNAG